MKATSSYLGYTGLYEIFENCIVVGVYIDKGKAERVFGFSMPRKERDVEYEFRDHVESYVSKRPKIYKDLVNRHNRLKNGECNG